MAAFLAVWQPAQPHLHRTGRAADPATRLEHLGAVGDGVGAPSGGTHGHSRCDQLALRAIAERARFLEAEIAQLDAVLDPIVERTAPALVARSGVGPDTAGALLVAVGDNPERLRSEASFAHLCGVAPIEASSGKVDCHRLDRGGDRQANSAIWRIVITRMSCDPDTRAYVERRMKEGRSKLEAIRCLKRYVARELYAYLPVEVARRAA